MRKVFLIVFFLMFCVRMNAQRDSVPGFCVSVGSGIGLGFSFGPVEKLNQRYDLLHDENRIYLDFRENLTFLFKEKFGFRILAGQVGRQGNGSELSDYWNMAYSGYKLVHEYSDLRSGYKYRYLTPQFVYRFGKEPFNATFCLGVGYGKFDHAYGIAILQENGSNNFIQMEYSAPRTNEINLAFDAEFAYMRQLSLHWYMNAGISVSYTGVTQDYDYDYTEQAYQQPYSFVVLGYQSSFLHHAALGIFLNFQWNKREGERAVYE